MDNLSKKHWEKVNTNTNAHLNWTESFICQKERLLLFCPNKLTFCPNKISIFMLYYGQFLPKQQIE